MNRKRLLITLFKKAYLIRASEEKIIKYYDNNEMKTPMHMSMGEEGIMAGVCTAIGKNALTFGTYRSHGLYLATANETDRFFAEMYGKSDGVLKGKGGSMHLLSPHDGLLGISAVVGSTIPVAVGAAYASTYYNKKQVSTVFFGDGAVDEGVFWESLNIACLKNLPVLFVCEDNGYAVHTAPAVRHGYKSLTAIVGQYNCSVFETDSTDAEKIYKLTMKALTSIHHKNKPAFLYIKYYRYLEHVGIHEDFHAGYRNKKEFTKWQKKDPVTLLRKKLSTILMTEKELRYIERKIDMQIEDSFQKALQSPFPSPSELMENTFYEETE
jgi:acetoin:2,6-dichlorophenolindophenol oxidoreductase subunit alpha